MRKYANPLQVCPNKGIWGDQGLCMYVEYGRKYMTMMNMFMVLIRRGSPPIHYKICPNKGSSTRSHCGGRRSAPSALSQDSGNLEKHIKISLSFMSYVCRIFVMYLSYFATILSQDYGNLEKLIKISLYFMSCICPIFFVYLSSISYISYIIKYLS